MSSGPNLVLIGFMACGKSTLGRRAAVSLGYQFRDTDLVVEQQLGKKVGQVFAEHGEAAFRDAERRAVAALADDSGQVIATGGGAIMDRANLANLRRSGVVVWLRVAPEELLMRAGDRESRPLLAGAADPLARVRELLAEREPTYNGAADAVVTTTGLARREAAVRLVQAFQDAVQRRGLGEDGRT